MGGGGDREKERERATYRQAVVHFQIQIDMYIQNREEESVPRTV
jgi:hypothetical protein